jgi:glutaredoxin
MAWQVLRIEADCAKVSILHGNVMKLRILIYALLFSAGASLAGNLFRWVDSDGTVHYSDQPPPPSVKKVEEKKFRASVIEGGPSYALQQAVKNFPITLFANDCGAGCTRARELLNKRGVPFTEKNPVQPENADELKKILGDLVVPVLVLGNTQPLRGFDESSWNNALNVAGYPSAPVPGAPAGGKSPGPQSSEAPARPPAPEPESKPY